MQAVRRNTSPWKKVIGSLLEIAGLIILSSGFLDLHNFLVETFLIMAGFLILVLGAKYRYI